jgi:hypothetical protein
LLLCHPFFAVTPLGDGQCESFTAGIHGPHGFSGSGKGLARVRADPPGSLRISIRIYRIWHKASLEPCAKCAITLCHNLYRLCQKWRLLCQNLCHNYLWFCPRFLWRLVPKWRVIAQGLPGVCLSARPAGQTLPEIGTPRMPVGSCVPNVPDHISVAERGGAHSAPPPAIV